MEGLSYHAAERYLPVAGNGSSAGSGRFRSTGTASMLSP